MDYTKLTIYELFSEYRKIVSNMGWYETEDLEWKFAYKELAKIEKSILEEAKRRDLVQEEANWDEFNRDYIENYERLNG